MNEKSSIGNILFQQPSNKKTLGRPVPNKTSRAEAKEGGAGAGKPPPGLGGKGSDWKGEKFGGSEEKRGDLNAEPVGRRIKSM